MSPGEKRTPGQVVSPAEMNDMVRELGEIYTHLQTNARHLARIEAKAERLKEELAILLAVLEQKAEEEVEEEEDPTPPQELIDAADALEEEKG